MFLFGKANRCFNTAVIFLIKKMHGDIVEENCEMNVP